MSERGNRIDWGVFFGLVLGFVTDMLVTAGGA